MNRGIVFLIVLLYSILPLTAQQSEGGVPYSLSIKQLKGTASLPEYRLKSFDRSALLEEDRHNPIPFRYAVFEDVNIDLKASGRKDTLPGQQGSIWRLKMQCDSAFSIQLILSKFNIPPGAKLFVYSEGYAQVLGAFTPVNMHDDSTLVIEDIIGNKAIVEYFEPGNVSFHGKVIIGSVSKSYKNIYQLKSGTDFININCSEGRDLQLPKHSVCRLSFRSGSSSYLCTGALINNVRHDGKPYLLTASHCIKDSAEAASLVAYFNYENEGCHGSALTAKTLSGAKIVTTSPASDYSLLLLNNKPASSYQPFYAGWDANDVLTNRVAGIHHPEGLTKKLSFDRDSIASNDIKIQWGQGSSASPVSSHWEVNFDEGLTAGGSSGSPLFNKKNQIIGQLHGGDSSNDLYGKFSYSWTHPSGKYLKLSHYLDPDSSGTRVMDGYSPASNPPDAFIDIPVSKVCLQAPVQLTDYSVFEPYTRTWTITPSTFIFAEGTSQTSANPVVEFLQPGSYSVKINISKSAGSDTMKIDNALQAGSSIDVGILSAPSGEACLCNFGHFTAWATGGTSYHWNVLPESADKAELNHNFTDTVEVTRAPSFQADSSLTVKISVTGTHGTCSDTAYLDYKLIQPVNDNVQNAIRIPFGTSGAYSNKCATIETGEPVPQHYSCTTQYSWCDEYGTGEKIVENSIWFKFVAPASGYVSIESDGFDNEIALYDANSSADIINQNYMILAANDDRSSTDYNPLIRSQQVTPGKTYWIQVDGSGGSQIGNFTLQLTATTFTALAEENQNFLEVFPQPAKDHVHIKGDILPDKPVQLSVFSYAGNLIYRNWVKPDREVITLDVSTWEKGVYIAKIESAKDILVTRIIKY